MITRRELTDGWEFAEAGSESWLPAVVPGCVQLDLMREGQLVDPFYRMNEFEAQSLEDKDWVYRTEFTLSEEDLAADELVLVFEGIDTYADVTLNDVALGSTANMFVAQRFDVTEHARPGRNTLQVDFYSAVTNIHTLKQNSPLDLISSTEAARPYIRKAQYADGWDWGPRLVQVGLWRPVRLEIVRGARVVDPFAYTRSVQDGTARLWVGAQVACYVEQALDAEVRVSLDGETKATSRVPVSLARGEMGFDLWLDVPDAQLWWPNGLGPQPLYTVTVRVLAGEQAIEETSIRVGLRTIRLIQESDVEGRSFIVAVNGVKVFCKGANWIPADSLLPRLTRQDYYDYIRLAAEANMNMLRIWGGGIYEDPAFYEACDEMGIMVWQDFMYSCAQYPDELDWFQEAARAEAEQVVAALRNHPSIVLWCGNNENNWGFDEWWHVGQPEYLGNYVYREILPAVCAELDPSRPYWVSSPYGGEHPNGAEEGDRHQWMVWSNWQDYGLYRQDTGRFLSEFGFQAMPDWKTVLSYTAPEDRGILTPVMRSHNKMAEGTERLLRFLAGRLGLPKDLRSFVYLTQFNQAEAIKTGVEHWRLRQFMTSGALYWQLNDCWPVASWSSLDYCKRKKGLYYYTKAFFAPVLPVLQHVDGRITLHGVSDLLETATGRARIRAYGLDGTPRGRATVDVTLLPNQVTPLVSLSLADLGIGEALRVLPVEGNSQSVPRAFNGELLDTVVYVDLTVGDAVYRNYLVFDRFRELALHEAAVSVAKRGSTLTLTTDVPAFGVFLETDRDVDLSDNCLNLEPGREVVVRCSGDPGEVRVVHLAGLIARI
jgi:beta-mannosidase